MMIAFAIAAGIITLIAWACCWIGGKADDHLDGPLPRGAFDSRPDPRTLDQLGSDQPHSGGDKTAFNHGPATTAEGSE